MKKPKQNWKRILQDQEDYLLGDYLDLDLTMMHNILLISEAIEEGPTQIDITKARIHWPSLFYHTRTNTVVARADDILEIRKLSTYHQINYLDIDTGVLEEHVPF